MTTDPMEEIRASFFVECEELMESLHDALGVLDAGEGDSETINVVFRAVHSIKGGAGAFGFDPLVGFAHRFETVLDELRAGRLELTPEATRAFFQGADLLYDHIRAARDASPPPAEAERVLGILEGLLGEGGVVQEEEVNDFQPMGLSFDFGGALPDAEPEVPVVAAAGHDQPCWQIDFRPHPDLYQTGNEPLLILRALATLGETQVTCLAPAEMALDDATAEQSCLAWRVTLTGPEDDTEIRELFDFVTDLCDLEIARHSGTAPTGTGPAPEILRLDPSQIVAAANDDHPFVQAADTAAERVSSPVPAPVLHAPLAAPAPVPAPAVAPAPAPAAVASVPVPVPAAAAPAPTPAPAAAAEATKGKAAAPAADAAGPTVRVDLERVDRLVNLVGELVINQAMLAQSVAQAGMAEHSAVMNGLEEFMMLTRDIQDSVMMIRAQPVKPLFQRMARIVREASAAVGKQVRLRTEGENTEVDKTVIERLADPLTHMIRNAVDHGLETPEKRAAAGKPTEGVITLSATHRAGRILIEIADDGAGINRPRVREIAISKGLIPADAQLTDGEIDNLLFLPGFSTASQISALSGRGVGMDVVKNAINALGGRIAITSEAGVGTRFSISLPLTLAVLDGMVVRVAGQTLVVPLSAIVETPTLAAGDVRRIGRSTNVLHIRGELVPLFDLGVQLGFREDGMDHTGSIVILTNQDDGTRVALIVDSIEEQRQVVIKGLSPDYGRIQGVAAATILGDGQVALILDPSDLARPPQTQDAPSNLPLAG